MINYKNVGRIKTSWSLKKKSILHLKHLIKASVPGEGREPSPIMETFLKMATSTVYKMAGLGSFQDSQTYKVIRDPNSVQNDRSGLLS